MGVRGACEVGAKKGGTFVVQANKNGLQLSKGGRTIYKQEYGPDAFVSSIRGRPGSAVLHIEGKPIELTFASQEDCVEFVLAARAFSAYDKLRMICSLPAVNKEEFPNVSIVNAIIQAGCVIEPYTWGPLPEVEVEEPSLEESDLQKIAAAVKKLVNDRRIKASAYAVLMGVLSAASQGSLLLGLPRAQAFVEPESEEEPEEPESEPEAEAGAEPGAEEASGQTAAVSREEVQARVVGAEGGVEGRKRRWARSGRCRWTASSASRTSSRRARRTG